MARYGWTRRRVDSLRNPQRRGHMLAAAQLAPLAPARYAGSDTDATLRAYAPPLVYPLDKQARVILRGEIGRVWAPRNDVPGSTGAFALVAAAACAAMPCLSKPGPARSWRRHGRTTMVPGRYLPAPNNSTRPAQPDLAGDWRCCRRRQRQVTAGRLGPVWAW